MATFLIGLLFLFSPFPQTHSSSWHTELEKAQAEALSREKPILMVFSGSDWCKPCIRLKQEVFETTDFQTYASEELSLLQVDFPRRRKNKLADEVQAYRNTLAEKYNPNGYFPRVLLLDADGKILEEISYKGGGLKNFIISLELAKIEE